MDGGVTACRSCFKPCSLSVSTLYLRFTPCPKLRVNTLLMRSMKFSSMYSHTKGLATCSNKVFVAGRYETNSIGLNHVSNCCSVTF